MDTGVRGAKEEEKLGTRAEQENSAILLGNIPTKHKKKKPKKEFVIEWRLNPEAATRFCFVTGWDKWQVFNRYATEKQRDEAFEVFQRKSSGTWEYRIV